MDVTATQPTTSSQQATPDNSVADEDATTSSALTTDFETFLRLLTTQLENQDPLNPLDSTEFVAQLANFSAVEQQVNTNTKLDGLIDAVSSNNAALLGQWVGTEVRSTAATDFDGTPVDVFYQIPAQATHAEMVVKNDQGLEVARFPVPRNSQEIAWDGVDGSGQILPLGSYGFTLESYEDTVSLGQLPSETFSRVNEARLEDNAIVLVFNDGTQLGQGEVKAVRNQ